MERSLVGLVGAFQYFGVSSLTPGPTVGVRLRQHLQRQIVSAVHITVRLYEAVIEIKGKADELGPPVGAVWAKCDEIEQGPLDDASFAKYSINQLIPILKVVTA